MDLTLDWIERIADSYPRAVRPDPPLQVLLDRGDDCHRNVHNVSDGQADKLRKNHVTAESLRLCVRGTSLPFTADDAIALQREYFG
jgi:hypothetical protein